MMIRSTRIVYIEVIIVVVYCNDEIRNKRVDDDDDDDAVVCELWLKTQKRRKKVKL